jgi:hypothetical protein
MTPCDVGESGVTPETLVVRVESGDPVLVTISSCF